MRNPATTLDLAYSDPAAAAVEWKETRKVLEDAELFWISTVRGDGRPHVTPVVAAWVEDSVWFATGDEEQKFANLLTDPHVVLTTGCNEWQSGLDVVIEVDAVRVSDDVLLSRVAAAFTTKWDRRWQYFARDGRFRGTDGSGGRWCFRSPLSKCLLTPKEIHSAPRYTGSRDSLVFEFQVE